MGVLARVLSGAVSVLIDAWRLLVRHWPVLAVLFLLGYAVRNAVLWAAILLSPHAHFFGALLVPLAPLAMLTAMILMLRTLADSMSHVDLAPPAAVPTNPVGDQETRASRRARAGKRRRLRAVIDDRLALLAGTIIPFLAVYAGQGYLVQDRNVWLYGANMDQLWNASNPFAGVTGDLSVTTIADERTLWVIIAVAFGLRWLLGRFQLADRNTGWGLFAAWLEVTWVTLFATKASHWLDGIWAWITSRALVTWFLDLWHTVLGWLGPLTGPVESVTGWLAGAVDDIGAVILIPLAWLAVGAVAVGHTLPDLNPNVVTRQAERRLTRLPSGVRSSVTSAVTGITNRFSDLIGGLRLLATAGLVPMLLFCLVFVAAGQFQLLTWLGVRAVTGPMSPDDSFPLAPILEVLPRTVYTLAAIVLMAAAINRLVGARRPDDSTDSAQPAESEPAGTPAEIEPGNVTEKAPAQPVGIETAI
ncbi:MAG: hypothetical protein ACK5MP_06610 [Nostocoides sp.]